LLSSSWYFEHLYRRHPTLVRTPLQGPGGQMGRLARMLEAHPDRPVAFENEALARRLGLETCAGPVFAHARVACSSLPEHLGAFTKTVAAITTRTDAGEPTVTGALAAISLDRAR